MKRLAAFFLTSLLFFTAFILPADGRTGFPPCWIPPKIDDDGMLAMVRTLLSAPEGSLDAKIDSVGSLMRGGVSSRAMLKACDMVREAIDTASGNPQERLSRKANYYALLYGVYNQVPDTALSMASIDTARRYAEQLPASVRKALVFADYGSAHQCYGSTETAHRYLRRAIDEFRALGPGYEVNISICCFQLATDYLNMGDRDGLNKCMEEMRLLMESNPAPSIAYDYYSVLSSYYDVVYADEGDERWRDSAMIYSKAVISAMEKVVNPARLRINPVWAYYNVAVMYELYYRPPVTDSIEHYLVLAERVNESYHRGLPIKQECDISLMDLRAWLYYEKGDYADAERTMNEVLALLDEVEKSSPNTVVTERGEAYSFFVEFYESRNRYEDALRYQKLLTENNGRRYDIARNRALHDLQVRYEVEKKEARITRLEEKNRAARAAVVFTVFIAAVLLGALLLLWFVFRLRKINLQQRLYEAALTAELSDRELARLHRQLGADVSRSVAESLKAALESSPLDREAAARYRTALDGLSFQDADRLLASSAEPLTGMDRKYILCFLIGMSTPDVCALFSVEPGSVYVVRSRLRKKFGKGAVLPF